MYQVPPPLFIGIDYTCYTKFIHIHVCVSHTGYVSEKHFCSVKIFYHQRGIKPNIAFIFGGTGKGVIDLGGKSYEHDALLF